MSDKYGAPWVVKSPPKDSHAFDVFKNDGFTKVHHGHWGGRDVACLISAAPEMLEVCRATLAELERLASSHRQTFSNDIFVKERASLNAVIKRAEGK